MTQFVKLGALLLIAAPAVFAQEPAFDTSRTVIVITSDAAVKVESKDVANLRPGELMTWSIERTPWLFVPRKSGWVHGRHVLAVDKAEEYFTKIIAEEPSPEAYHHRGIARSARGEHQRAIADYTKAAELGENSAALYTNRGTARQAIGDTEGALADYSQAIELDPEFGRAWDNRGNLKGAAGDLEGSLADANQAVKLAPDLADVWNNRGVTYRELGQWEQAEADYDKAIELDRFFAGAYANRGYVRKQLGRYEQALADYREAMRLEPTAPEAFNDAAWLLATCPVDAIRDGERAVTYAEKACALTDYQVPDYLDTLAAAHAEAGNFEKAITWIQAAITKSGDDVPQELTDRLRLFEQQRQYREQPSQR